MALFIKQDFDERSELQNRIATELQERSKKRSGMADRPDGVEDSQYIEGTKVTTSLAWVWAIIIIVTIGIVIWLTVLGMAR